MVDRQIDRHFNVHVHAHVYTPPPNHVILVILTMSKTGCEAH